jgi:hypothetical protein
MELVGCLHITAADAFRHPIYKYVNNGEIIYYVDYGGKSILLSLPDKYKKDDLSIVLSHNRTTYENEKHNATFGNYIHINDEPVESVRILDYNLLY